VVEFLKRQLNYDTKTLQQMMGLVRTAQNRGENGTASFSLDVLTQLRKFLEASHPELLKTRPVHGKNRLKRRINELVEFVKHIGTRSKGRPFGKAATILDVGAGNGQIVSGLANALGVPSARVYALELAEYPNRAQDVQWIGYNEEGEIPLPDQSVDVITIMMVFHHAPDPQHLITEVFRVLRPGGQVIIRETDASDQATLGLKSDEVIALNQILDNMLYVVFDPNSGVPMMNNYRPGQFWQDLYEKTGFEVEKFQTMEPGSPFQPIYFHLTKP
jgi:ubiquinone/menaquinone biosynthesis C-methylase UbiE